MVRGSDDLPVRSMRSIWRLSWMARAPVNVS